MLTLSEIQKVLKATCFTHHCLDDKNADTACGADLLSDVLAHSKEKTVLLTGLINPQVIRTAEIIDLIGVIFIRGKVPSQEIVDLAEAKDIPLLCTVYPMYESCGLLYQAGLGVICHE
ncbi:hypothetical protein L7E55_12025 [Pelotomaculum isophthalicicum JI]|uniref:DRTGG domain-containing protein n=1 Tax=Pelotomaculum isophthalicicum JI TaxID=947010 RepID=A0A9X4H4W3_9FIRM|nr:hypothetical protein [Pelotomaculum isophthalicicum]MDF9409078.1 hypothetical protein [Pelotomaculum isophthalicicum JI]